MSDERPIPVDPLDGLLFELDHGTLTPEDRHWLEQRLRGDAAARRRLVELRLLDAALWSETGVAPELAVPAAAMSRVDMPAAGAASRRGLLRWWPAVLVAALLAALVGRWLHLETAATALAAAPEPTAHGVALLTRLVGAAGRTAEGPLAEGAALPPGELVLDGGFAQVEFLGGATLVLQGPATLELIAADRARVVSGRLRAQVPPAARGFTLLAGDATVVDLGTEFGLDVSSEATAVQVFDGEVELHTPGARVRRLVEGEAVERTAGATRDSDMTPGRYVDLAALDVRAEDATAVRLSAWRTHSRELRADPRLLAYHTFDAERPWRRRLPDDRPGGDRPGAIVGAGFVQGRWPGKGGLEFKRPADRVRIEVPGTHRSLSLACWVRIDSLQRAYSSLMLTDGYEVGAAHWQILAGGRLFFSLRVPAWGQWRHLGHRPIVSPPFWTPELSGRWFHLATTYDGATGRVVHYLDGKPIHADTLRPERRPAAVRIGRASLGNWAAPTKPDADFAVRNLDGRLDEFALFDAALTPTEIAEMHHHGRP